RGFFFPPEVLIDCQRVATCEDDWHERLDRVLDRRTDWFLLETQGPGGALWRAMEGKVTPRYLDEGMVIVSAVEVRKWRDLFVTGLGSRLMIRDEGDVSCCAFSAGDHNCVTGSIAGKYCEPAHCPSSAE